MLHITAWIVWNKLFGVFDLKKKSNTPNSFDGRCNLCLEEKIHILTYKLPDKLLDKRSELIARCRQRTKFKL